MKWGEWGAFLLLSLIWGTSFYWIKIGVQDIGPLTLVTLRLLIGTASLYAYVRWRGIPLPTAPRDWALFAVIGLFNVALPFALIAWAEVHIESGVAAVLNSAVPLFALVMSHVWLNDPVERITARSLGGLLVGFAGVVILMSRDLHLEASPLALLGQLAVIGGSACYAGSLIFIRLYLRQHHPNIQGLMQLLLGGLMVAAAIPFLEWPVRLPTQPMTWVAVLWLGLLGSGLAYVFFFGLAASWGPTRISMVTYVVPVFAVIFGVGLLGETADWRLLAGGALILLGVVIVNWRSLRQLFNSA